MSLFFTSALFFFSPHLLQLLPLIDKALGSCALQSGPLFPQITEMLVSWEKRAVGNEAATFLRLLSDFWEGLNSLCVRYVDHEEQQVEQVVLQGIASLLQIMQNPDSYCTKQGKRRKAVKVCFSEEVVKRQEEETPSQTTEVETLQGQEKQCSPLRSSHLLELVCQLAELNMVYVSERDSERHLHFLALLLQAFPKAQVFQGLLKPDDRKTEVELEAGLSENPAICFLLQRVVVWLRQDHRKDPDFLVDMVFSSLQCCSSNAEQTLVLNHITVRHPVQLRTLCDQT